MSKKKSKKIPEQMFVIGVSSLITVRGKTEEEAKTKVFGFLKKFLDSLDKRAKVDFHRGSMFLIPRNERPRVIIEDGEVTNVTDMNKRLRRISKVTKKTAKKKKAKKKKVK